MNIAELMAQRAKKGEVKEKNNGDAPPAAGQRKALKVIRTRETPNPNAIQFVLNAQVLSRGKKSWSNEEDCDGDKMGLELLEMTGIKSVYISGNFVTVTKDDFTGWNPLKARVWKTVDEHIQIYKPEDEKKEEPLKFADFQALTDEEKLQAVEEVLDRSIRSNLAKDGGGVEVKGVEGTEILIHYQGACGNCPSSSTGTLQFIEGQIKQQLDRNLTVKSV